MLTILRHGGGWTWLIGFLALVGCGKSNSSNAPGPARSGTPVIYTDNYPLAYVAEQAAAGAFEVRFPAPADVDPAYWRPGAAVVSQYQQADLILLNGAGYSRWTQSVSLPPSRVVDTSQEFHDQLLTTADLVVHKHGPEGEHTHEGLASHTWLDPRLLRLQARAVARAIQARGATKGTEHAWGVVERDISDLERELEGFARREGFRMLASHPVYDYLTSFCQWNTKSLHWEPGETPSEEQWAKFAKLHAAHPATIMLWEGEPSPETRQKLEGTYQVKCVVYELAANRPVSGDFLSVMRANIERLRQAMAP